MNVHAIRWLGDYERETVGGASATRHFKQAWLKTSREIINPLRIYVGFGAYSRIRLLREIMRTGSGLQKSSDASQIDHP